MSALHEVLAQERNRRAEEEYEEFEKRKRKNYESQLKNKNMAKAKAAAQKQQDRYIEMRIKGSWWPVSAARVECLWRRDGPRA